METREVIYAPKFTHEQAVEIFRRLVADKHEAEQQIEKNGGVHPDVQAAVSQLKAKHEQRQITQADV